MHCDTANGDVDDNGDDYMCCDTVNADVNDNGDDYICIVILLIAMLMINVMTIYVL